MNSYLANTALIPIALKILGKSLAEFANIEFYLVTSELRLVILLQF